MDPTTLITFLFRAPPDSHTVELLGSWDNFQRPYRMYHDRRRGNGFHSGCFSFENIVFDGDVNLQQTKARTGGLKQGGTYWYYYRLNYDAESFDDHQPHTTACPLLPGQTVNIIDVPLELIQVPSRCHSVCGNLLDGQIDHAPEQTLDPATKFTMLLPPPISRVHGRCLSDDALGGRLEGQIRIEVDSLSSLSETSSLGPEEQMLSQQRNHEEETATRRGSGTAPLPSNELNSTDEIQDHAHDAEATSLAISAEVDCLQSQLETLELPILQIQPVLEEHSFSGRSFVLPTLIEDVDLDDAHDPSCISQPSLAFTVPFHCSESRPSTLQNVETLPTNDLSIRNDDSRPHSAENVDLSHDPPFRLASSLYIDLDSSGVSSFSASPTLDSSMPSLRGSDHPTPDYEAPEFRFPAPAAPTTNPTMVNDHTIHSLSSRLHALSDPAPHAASQRDNPRPRANIWTYSLPSDVTDSNHSLAKTLSAHSHHTAIPVAAPTLDCLPAFSSVSSLTSALERATSQSDHHRSTQPPSQNPSPLSIFVPPLPPLPGEDEPSIAEAIWTELGYLGESIA